jgi:peptidyl-prolyl cis-trans isomerase SurA
MKKILPLIVFVFASAVSFAQRVPADKIIGIVGDKIILQSDINNQIMDMKRQNIAVPDDAKCLLMEQTLAMKALVLQAEKDSLPVSDEEIESELDRRIRYFIGAYGSKEAVEQIAGRSIFQLKEDLRTSIRENLMAQAMQKKITESIKITPQEVKKWWDKIPADSLPFYEQELEIGQIISFPKASRDVEKLAIEELNDFKKQIETGQKKFETLVELYSDDPGSKKNGGKYEVNRNDKQWDPTFLATCFRLKEGEISNVIKSKFGYHIIRLESRFGDDAVVRHILRIPQITSFEIEDAKKKLDSVRSRIIAGTLSFGEAVNKYSDDEAGKFTAGITTGTIDQFDKELVAQLGNLKVGDISMPLEYKDERDRKGVRLIYLRSKTEAHRENFRDDYNKIAQRALEEKKANAVEEWFAKKIPSYYIMIDSEFRSCQGNMKRWMESLSKN